MVTFFLLKKLGNEKYDQEETSPGGSVYIKRYFEEVDDFEANTNNPEKSHVKRSIVETEIIPPKGSNKKHEIVRHIDEREVFDEDEHNPGGWKYVKEMPSGVKTNKKADDEVIELVSSPGGRKYVKKTPSGVKTSKYTDPEDIENEYVPGREEILKYVTKPIDEIQRSRSARDVDVAKRVYGNEPEEVTKQKEELYKNFPEEEIVSPSGRSKKVIYKYPENAPKKRPQLNSENVQRENMYDDIEDPEMSSPSGRKKKIIYRDQFENPRHDYQQYVQNPQDNEYRTKPLKSA